MPAIRDPAKAVELISRRHREYHEYVTATRWVLDTLEGGIAYRDAVYGADDRGKPIRNLMRHKREYPDPVARARDEYGWLPFESPGGTAHDDAIEFDYELRRARTPVPNFLGTFIERQLSKIFKRPIARSGPQELLRWSQDIDGRRTSLDEWMRETIGPLLIALGMIDVQFGHPAPAPDEPDIVGSYTRDSRNQCVINYILPENVLWWRLDYTKHYYVEVLIQEIHPDGRPGNLGKDRIQYRHWTPEDWTLYNDDGTVDRESTHPFGVPPIVRLFDRRNLRCEHTGSSRMQGIVDKSRAYYNEESELIANNTMHNCPLLQGPGDDAAGASDDTVPIGRNYMLKKIVDRNGNHVGYEYVTPPTNPSEFARLRLFDIREQMEREAALTRSIGSVGTSTGAGPVAQSGISKAFDQEEGSGYLASVAKTLESGEYAIWYYALAVLRDGIDRITRADFDAIEINYPREFNLLSFEQFSQIVAAQQAYLKGGVGNVPTEEKETLKAFARMKFPDASVERLKQIDQEIDILVDDAVKSRQAEPDRVALPAPAAVVTSNGISPSGVPTSANGIEDIGL